MHAQAQWKHGYAQPLQRLTDILGDMSPRDQRFLRLAGLCETKNFTYRKFDNWLVAMRDPVMGGDEIWRHDNPKYCIPKNITTIIDKVMTWLSQIPELALPVHTTRLRVTLADDTEEKVRILSVILSITYP